MAPRLCWLAPRAMAEEGVRLLRLAPLRLTIAITSKPSLAEWPLWMIVRETKHGPPLHHLNWSGRMARSSGRLRKHGNIWGCQLAEQPTAKIGRGQGDSHGAVL